VVLEPDVLGDERGFFLESYNRRTFAAATGIDVEFVQDNQSHSSRGVLRGLHYQLQQAQGKLLRVVSGETFDVAVDLRRSSPHFGRWTGVILSATNHRQLWIPPGFGHGFLVLSDHADLLYKATEYYAPKFERSLAWNDPAIGIQWPLPADISQPTLSAKDREAHELRSAEVYP
jgi:dTDP-4-dehydrorhamnose 3,5-epimerase